MRNALKAFVLLAAGLAAFVFVSPQASAASAGTAPMSMKGVVSGTALESFIEQVQYRGRCRRWNRRCRRRFGRGRDYRRCMRRRGCARRGRVGRRARYCRRWNRRCRRRFGRGWDYRRCMIRRGCRRYW